MLYPHRNILCYTPCAPTIIVVIYSTWDAICIPPTQETEMGYGWMGNYEAREGKARFIPADAAQPEVVWPGRGFRGDSEGGHGYDCVTDSRYDVLAKDSPSWAAVVLSAAIAAEAPLRAVRIGSAGKYRFWRLCAASPAAAQAESAVLKAAWDVKAAATAAAAESAALKRLMRAPEGRIYADGVQVPAAGVFLGSVWSPWPGNRHDLWWDAAGASHQAGAIIEHDPDGHEKCSKGERRGTPDRPGPPDAAPETAEYADEAWWQEELARIDADIAAARAAKKAAKQATAPAALDSNPFAALAAARTP